MLANTSPNDKSSSIYAGPTQPIPKKSLQIRTDKPRPHVCSICTRAFARLEHLKRHERSHTNEKPFQCAACGRCFARRDLVLRHQHKLHSKIFLVVRRGLLPTSLLQQSMPESTTLTPTGDNIIILQNNTSAKAPLPNLLGVLSPNMGLGILLPINGDTPKDYGSQYRGLMNTLYTDDDESNNKTSLMGGSMPADHSYGALGVVGQEKTIPSPSTNSSHNTPSFTVLGNNYPSFADSKPLLIVDALGSDMTQQPSPLTGDSPELRDKTRNAASNQHKSGKSAAFDRSGITNLFDAARGALSRTNSSYARHASFLAVSGISYSNLRDAMTIRSTQSSEIPQKAGVSSPQLTSEEIESKGFDDFGNLDLDWYTLSYGNKDKTNEEQDKLCGQAEFSGRSLSSDSSATGFKTKLNTIPSELHLAPTGEEDYFPSNIVTGHQFQDPSHPHHIKGTTPIEFGYSSFTDVASVLEAEEKNREVGTGFAHLVHDILDLKSVSSGAQGIQPGLLGFQPGLRRRALTILNNDFKRANSRDFKREKTVIRRELPTNRRSVNDTSGTNLFQNFKDTDLAVPDLDRLGSANFPPASNITSAVDVEDLTWVESIRDMPVPSVFPLASRNTGFDGFPYINDQYEPDEVYTLFKLRQDDLVKQRSMIAATADKLSVSSTDHNVSIERPQARAKFTIGDSNDVISEEFRAKIVQESKLGDLQFPPCEDLNAYLALYEKEFNPYYPFIHMSTLKAAAANNTENVPLLLLMCAIGALYLYHDLNTLLLFNLSKFHIHNFFEKEVTANKLQLNKVPFTAHQCLVLHIFISMFLNEPNMVEITLRQMNSMVGLIKLTNFHRPLEKFLVPPAPPSAAHDHAAVQSNFDYFIMAQSRVRTIHTFYQLEVLRSAFLGCSLPMGGKDVRCGTHCSDENLWRLRSADEWYQYRQTTPNKSLVELSNNEGMDHLFEQLNSGEDLLDSCGSFNKSFALIMHVHEQILHEYSDSSGDVDTLTWRISQRPRLEKLIKLWEGHFVRSGGFSLVNSHNHHLLQTRAELKLIMPMLLLAKMRVCINFTPIITQVLYKDWHGMEVMLQKLDLDKDALRDAAGYASEVLNLWIHNISMLNDAKQTSVRTPVFFVTCIFISVVVLSKVIRSIETSSSTSICDRAFWISCVKVLEGIETALSPKEESSYSEFLRAQSHGVFDYAWSSECKENVERTTSALTQGDMAIDAIRLCKLSILALSLGVRILADAPLWPLAMGFAEALKNMAIQFNE